MNRFLAGLVERAEGRAPVLQRRPRSLFEPESPSGGAIIDPLERDEVRVAAPARREPRDEAPPSPRSLDQTLHPRDEEHRTMASRAEASPPLPSPGRGPVHPPMLRDEPRSARRTPVVPRVDEVATAPRRGTPRPAPVASPSATPIAVGAQRHAPTISERPTTKASAVAPTGHARRPVEPPPPPPRTPSAQRAPTAPVAPTMVSRARPVAQHPAVMLARAQTAVIARREQAAAPAPAPVQITIGRVEVRAAPAGSERAPRNVGPATPRLSLDDYLRQRNGGSR